MKITCNKCQQELNIDDAKIPSGPFKLKCPKCGKVITTQKEIAPSAAPFSEPSEQSPVSISDEQSVPPAVEAYVKKELSSFRKEILGAIQALFGGEMRWRETGESAFSDETEEGTKVLLCLDDAATAEVVSATLKNMKFVADIAVTSAEAMKKLDSSLYEMILLDLSFPDDKEGGRKIIARINGWKPVQRRQTFLVLLSSNVRTMDSNQAFMNGVNLTVNKADLKNLATCIREGLKHTRQTYQLFNRLLLEKKENLSL